MLRNSLTYLPQMALIFGLLSPGNSLLSVPLSRLGNTQGVRSSPSHSGLSIDASAPASGLPGGYPSAISTTGGSYLCCGAPTLSPMGGPGLLPISTNVWPLRGFSLNVTELDPLPRPSPECCLWGEAHRALSLWWSSPSFTVPA